jgi:hypothetical protein
VLVGTATLWVWAGWLFAVLLPVSRVLDPDDGPNFGM